MKLTLHHIQQVLHSVAGTRDQELNCEECYRQIEQFVELEISGKSPDQAMPLVDHHLKMCGECREEYEILREALQRLKG